MKTKILKFITLISFIAWFVTLAMLDSATYIPHIINFASGIWLSLIGIANQDYFENL